MVEFIRSDLEAILFHIKIAEANARGQRLFGPDPDGPGPLLPGLIPTYNLSWGVRTVDGSYNNLLPGREYWGAADQPFTTHMDPTYRTFQVDMGPTRGGVQTMNYTPTLVDPDGPGRAKPGDVYDPALRTISNLIVDQTLANPAAIMESMRRDGIEGDLLEIALEIKAANEALPALNQAAAAAQVAETAALAALATETGQQAAAAAAAVITAGALAAANAAVAQDGNDLAAATAASQAADVAVGVAQAAKDAAFAALGTAQSAYDAAVAAAGANAAAIAAASSDLAAATTARNAAAAALTAAAATAASKQAAEAAAAANLLTAQGVRSAAQSDNAAAQTALADANDGVAAAEAALAIATANSDDADAALALAQSNAAEALAAIATAQDALDDAVIANQPSADALAAATTALAGANDAVTAADAAIVTATANNEAAATALATAQGDKADADAALATAQSAYDDALAAHQPTAAALATASSNLAAANLTNLAAVAAVSAAIADAAAMQVIEDTAAGNLTTAEANLTAAQDALAAAVIANGPTAAALATANANLVTATTAYDAATAAVTTATADAAAAQALEDTAAGNLATAQGNLTTAQEAFEAATLANAPTAAALAAATTDLADATTARDAAVTAVATATSNVAAAEALEAIASDDFAAAQSDQITTEIAFNAATATLQAYDDALAEDAEVSAGAALTATEALLTQLGTTNRVLQTADYQAVTDALTAATAASSAAAAALAALQGPGVAQTDLDAAEAAADGAALLVTTLELLQSNMLVEPFVADNLFFANAALSNATTSAGLATASTEGMVEDGRPNAQAGLALAQAALDEANAAFTAADLALTTATANRVAAEDALALAENNEIAAQAALVTAQTAHAAAVAANQPSADALAAAAADVATATNAVTAAQTALATATANSAAADAALATAQGNQATAQIALDAAQDAVDAAVIANAPSAAALAAATTAVGVASDAVTAAEGALSIATANSDAADAAVGEAQAEQVATQAALEEAQTAYQAAVAASQPFVDALNAAAADLAAAQDAVAAADSALAEATADSEAAGDTLASAEAAKVTALAALDAAETAYDEAVAANQPTADAVTAAAAALANAITSNQTALDAVTAALATAAEMAAAEDAATDDLATAQGLQDAAQTAADAASNALASANVGVNVAQNALNIATGESDAADAALALAEQQDDLAETALAGAQSAYDTVSAASGPAAAALAAATTALADATAAHNATQTALATATADAAAKQALEEAAADDLAAAQAAQATAAGNDAAAQAALTTANGELAAAQTAAAAATAASNAADSAAEQGAELLEGLLLDNGIELSGENVVLPAVATDEGLSAPFNSWFTLFGQFFDHGLDLVNKGGSGSVFIPLAHDDPLYDPGPDGIAGTADDSRTNFMVLTRATNGPGADGVFGTADDVRPLNTTTSFVDQNQTYGSHSSHQVFLREYVLTPTGPKATGHLIEGANGGMANWGELKHYASTILGIRLLDSDVGKVPLLRTDAYGNFIPGANGFPQVITGIGADLIPNTADDIVIEGDPTANGGEGVSIAMAIRTNSMFLADIAHEAAPNGAADSDSALGLDKLGASNVGTYDDELLDKHFIAGDGRVNENIGLITVHHIFHAEHNRMAEHTKSVVLKDAQDMLAAGASVADAIAFLNEWLTVDVATVPTSMTGLVWDGERIFQAARFGTEMQYQHLVFEEFARKVQPTINVFLVPDGYDAEINPSIMAEFAHVVYRFGHSMLTETVDRYDANFNADHIGLIEAFLNPVEFDSNGTVMDGIAAGEIIRGMTRQVGNQIDEFVTTALRDNLLGLPLDLATINLARGRDTGVPSLNASRREFYEVTGNNEALKPYESWSDFAANLKNEASIINFIAAYGTHSLITSQTTIDGKRDAALTIITGTSVGGMAVPEDAVDFLNATGAYAGGSLGGLENVDLWIGGLAERTMPFGGMLGSTFNFVFEVQMESLQNGDRFYYLGRNTGQHLFEQLEANSLGSMIGRHTDAKHLPMDVFSTPAFTLEVDQSKQYNDIDGDGDLEHNDPVGPGLVSNLVIRNNPATSGPDSNYLRYTGDEHVVLGGTAGNETLIAGIGDDTIHGDAGDDRIEGNFGNDALLGGDGDDIMTDQGGDDVFKGGKGNDALSGGSGIDLYLAGDGNDFVVGGTDDGSEVFAGRGNDFVLNSVTTEPVFGNEGDDWLERGGTVGLIGDNLDDGFARDGIRGNDVFVGYGGFFDEYIGEGGDDIMVGSLGGAKQAGMSGWDWVTYKNLTGGINASFLDDFIFDEAPVDPADIAIQRFESVEGLSGTRFNDQLTGGDFTSAARDDHAFLGSFLDAQGIALIDGLQALVGNGVTFFNAGDMILGGDGNDQIVGGGGDDIIDGDKWLNVRISVRENKDGTGREIATADSMTELTTRIFNGTFNPGQLVIVREILSDNTNVTGPGMNVDTAIYSGVLAEYDIEGRTVNAAGVQLTRARDVNGDGKITISHVGGTTLDGVDQLSNIEELRFADQTLAIAGPNATRAPIVDLHAFDVVSAMTAQYLDNFTVESFTNSNGITSWTAPWVESADGTNVPGAGQIQINVDESEAMRFIAGDGASITRSLSLDPSQPTTLSYVYSYSGIDTGDTLTVEFAADGVNFVAVQTITGAIANNAALSPTVASFAVTGTANSALRFTVSTLTDIEGFRIDDVSVVSGTTGQVAANDGLNFTTNYIEDNPAVPIVLNSSVTDTDSPTLVSAQVRLTNAQPFDVLSIAGALPAGITSTISPIVGGVITINFTGVASPAAYRTAIEAVRYSNTSINPSGVARTIEVTVSDSEGPSQIATTTVNFELVNDAPITVADAIVTNISTGNIVVPEWVLLANDRDPELVALEISAVSAPVGIVGLSLATNPGAVTFADDGTAGGTFVYTANDGSPIDGTTNGAVTVTNTGYTTQADNFNGNQLSAANNSTGTTSWAAHSWIEANDDANIRTGQVQIDGGAAPGTNQLRFGQGDGASISRVVDLTGVTTATLSLTFDKNNIDVGESVLVQFAADGVNFVTLNTITNTNGTAASGNANGTLSLALTGALGANSTIRFVGSGINAANEDIRLDNVVVAYGAPNADVTAGNGNQILIGNDAGSQFTGGGGNDTVLANGGDDVINWSVGNGRDFVDGGANGAAGDRFIVNGNATIETFVVYARAEAIAAGVTVLNAATEIVITRNGIANVVAELDNIEEITINTGAGADTVTGVGNFGPTSLFFNTITVNGGAAGDSIDASQLTSAHRLVLNNGEEEMVVVQEAVIPVSESLSRAELRWLDRMDLRDLGTIDFGAISTRGHSVFAIENKSGGGVYRNPMSDRQMALDSDFVDFAHVPLNDHRALHFDAADYLII